MADKEPQAPVEIVKEVTLDALAAQYQSIVDPQKRADFYAANPLLKQKFSTLNHS
jgi:hypothetical protein